MATSGRDADGKPLLDDGSFAGMLSRYGFRFEEKDHWSGYFATISGMVQQTVFAEPLYWVHSGWIYDTSAPAGGIGSESRLWSNSPSGSGATAPWTSGNILYGASQHRRVMAFSLRYQ